MVDKNSEREYEQQYLNFVLKIIAQQLEEELESFDDLEFKFRRDPNHYAVAYRIACNAIKILKHGLDKPYFARIDFKEDNNLKKEYYIGKYNISDDKFNPIVIDWRAPIANLYYDSELGRASYECPDGVVSGELLLKRQLEISSGKIEKFHDVDIVSNDELLQKYLHSNNDMRLKNIVSTIQSEQNIAIRKPINVNTIIQGVAGSGKTTIALHRIAYLVYNYRQNINNSQYMVIGPNDVFLKYIESVLPDLDVNGINQQTFEKFAKEIIGEEINITDSSKKLNLYLSGKIKNDIPKLKSSLDYKIMLDLFLDSYFEKIITKGLKIKDFEVISQEQLLMIFRNALNQSDNFENTIEKFVILVSRYVEDNYLSIMSRFSLFSYEKFTENNSESYNNFSKDKKLISDEIKKGCKQTAKKYLSKYNLGPIKLYNLFINEFDKYNVVGYEYVTELKNETLKNIKSRCFDFEDLPALIHIRNRIGLDRSFRNYRHVVIDEAQDLGKFHFYVLKECLPNATFSIYGDIAQSIYDYRSIDSWDEVNMIIDNCELITFRKSYRTTDEIMMVANCVSENIGLPSSELSIRHGKMVDFNKVDTKDIPTYIKMKVDEYRSKGYKTIAIISKYPTQSNYINDDLYLEGLKIPNIDTNTDVTSCGNDIFTISNYLAKGLEFDAVIINGADESLYNSTNKSDMKMLYVALTRALHEMNIIYSDELSIPLEIARKKIENQNVSNFNFQMLVSVDTPENTTNKKLSKSILKR